MGFGLGSVFHAIGSAASGVAHAVGGAADWVGSEADQAYHWLADGDAANPGGLDPHVIYGYFHEGPGTGSYQQTQASLNTLTESMQGYSGYLTQAQQALGAGWQGTAADSAQQSFTPMTTSAADLATHASDTNTKLSAQIDTFSTTKNKVVQVPQNPPAGPSVLDYVGMVSPMTAPVAGVNTISADSAVSNYQNNAHANQAAYTGYQGQTNPQASGLPQGSTTSPTPPPSTGVVTPPVDPGNSYQPSVPSVHNTGSAQTQRSSSSRPGSGGPGVPPPHVPAGVTGGTGPQPVGSPPGTVAQGFTPPNLPTSTNPSSVDGSSSAGQFGGGAGVGNGPGSAGDTAGGGGFDGGVGAFGGVGGGGSSGFGGSGGSGFRSAGADSGGPGASGSGAGSGGPGARGSGAGGSGARGAGSRAGAVAGEEEGALGGRGLGASGGRGAAGASGMAGPVGGKGKGGEDGEHKAAAYLQEDDPDSLFGTDQKTVPPVIGEFEP
jgi:hypothetical protein